MEDIDLIEMSSGAHYGPSLGAFFSRFRVGQEHTWFPRKRKVLCELHKEKITERLLICRRFPDLDINDIRADWYRISQHTRSMVSLRSLIGIDAKMGALTMTCGEDPARPKQCSCADFRSLTALKAQLYRMLGQWMVGGYMRIPPHDGKPARSVPVRCPTCRKQENPATIACVQP
jgi:hypothetical protein